MSSIIAIVGPVGSGKISFAFSLAENKEGHRVMSIENKWQDFDRLVYSKTPGTIYVCNGGSLLFHNHAPRMRIAHVSGVYAPADVIALAGKIKKEPAFFTFCHEDFAETAYWKNCLAMLKKTPDYEAIVSNVTDSVIASTKQRLADQRFKIGPKEVASNSFLDEQEACRILVDVSRSNIAYQLCLAVWARFCDVPLASYPAY